MSGYGWRAEKALAFLLRESPGRLVRGQDVAAACDPEFLVSITHGKNADQRACAAKWEDALDELAARGDVRKVMGAGREGPATDFGYPPGQINYYVREERGDHYQACGGTGRMSA